MKSCGKGPVVKVLCEFRGGQERFAWASRVEKPTAELGGKKTGKTGVTGKSFQEQMRRTKA